MKQLQRKGLWIAIYGPDGVGKSAVIEQLERQLARAFESISRFHFRPCFRRTCEITAAVTKPHAKPARGTLLSVAKLVYWLADCWWGYVSTILPRKYRGGLVIYDRYIPDLLVDPVRYRVSPPSLPFAAWLLALAPQPDLNVLLDASADVVQQRKCELSLSESHRQQLAYRRMFEHLQCTLLVNAELPVAEVSRRVAVGIGCLQSELTCESCDCSFVRNL